MSEYRIENKCVQGGYTPAMGSPDRFPFTRAPHSNMTQVSTWGSFLIWRHPAISIPDCKTPPAIWLRQKLLRWKAAQQQC